jgi:hypothetical protein
MSRARPYDYRRDGASGRVTPFKYAGGIFGQPNRPRNHLGIFEAKYAIPDYIEQAELDGGPLFADTLRADSTQAEPIEKGITAPDLGPPIRELYPRYKRRALGDDVVTTTIRETVTRSASTPSTKKGLLQRPIAGPLVLIGVGAFIAYAIWGGE